MKKDFVTPCDLLIFVALLKLNAISFCPPVRRARRAVESGKAEPDCGAGLAHSQTLRLYHSPACTPDS
jgi:hypothetical protein